MVENLLKKQAEKEARLAVLEDELKEHKGDAAAISAETDKLKKELAYIQLKLADKQDKLKLADRQLSDLKENMDAIQERTEHLKEEAYKYSRDVHSKVDSLLKDAMLENMVNEFRDLSARMTGPERQMFDGTLVQSIAEQGKEVMHCATLLFLGMVDMMPPTLCRNTWRRRKQERPQMGTGRRRGQPCMGSPLHEDGKSHDEACNRQEAQALTGIPDP